MVTTTDAFVCPACGDLYASSKRAERCEAKCRLLRAMEGIAAERADMTEDEYIWRNVRYFEQKWENLLDATEGNTDEVDPETGGKVMRRIAHDSATPGVDGE